MRAGEIGFRAHPRNRQSVAEHVRAVESILAAGCEYLRLGSGALLLAYTAAGRGAG